MDIACAEPYRLRKNMVDEADERGFVAVVKNIVNRVIVEINGFVFRLLKQFFGIFLAYGVESQIDEILDAFFFQQNRKMNCFCNKNSSSCFMDHDCMLQIPSTGILL